MNKKVVNFTIIWNGEYLKGLPNTPAGIESKIYAGKHFLPVFGNKELNNIATLDIKITSLSGKTK